VPTSYLLCSADRMVNPDWSRRAAQARLAWSRACFPAGIARCSRGRAP
jgi:hypothetical protein